VDAGADTVTAVAQTVTGGLSNLTRLNQPILDGTVDAVTATGLILVNVGAPGSLYAGSVVDYRFKAGERVRMIRADDGTWQVLGPAPRGTSPAPASLPAVIGPQAAVSQSLQAALLRFAAKSNQMLKVGTVTGVRSDGTMEINLRVGARLARATTTHRFRAGEQVYAAKLDNGSYTVVGPGRAR
jgi:hypothetical protein